jgi:hypothetical protein
MPPELQKLIDSKNWEMAARTISAIEDDAQFIEAMSLVPVDMMFAVVRADPSIIPRVERLMKENRAEMPEGEDIRYERIYEEE